MSFGVKGLTSALDGEGGQRHTSVTLTPGKTRYPWYRRLGEPQRLSEQIRKISHPPGFDPPTVCGGYKEVQVLWRPTGRAALSSGTYTYG
jgi:hypothetical protein